MISLEPKIEHNQIRLGARLPRTQVFNYYKAEEGERLEFRLFYHGPLPPERCEDRNAVGGGGFGRARQKHELRKHFHRQMRELWAQDPGLRAQSELWFRFNQNQGMVYPPDAKMIVPAASNEPGAMRYIEHLADEHKRCGGRFIPLVRDTGLTCSLDILFLRRDDPGNLIETGGDIDNRIKVLFDGLRMPRVVSELGGLSIEADEDPFYCLLQDDRLITSVSVTTDRLITPIAPGESIHDVTLVIHVTVVNPTAIFAGGRMV